MKVRFDRRRRPEADTLGAMRWICLMAVLALPAAAQDGGTRGPVDQPLFGNAEREGVEKAEAFVSKASHELRASLPPEWRRKSALGLEVWQWVGLPLLLVLAALLGLGVATVSLRLLGRITGDVPLRHDLEKRTLWPMRLGWFVGLMLLALPLLGLSATAETAWSRALNLVLLVAIFWGALRTVTSWSDHFATTSFVQSRPGSRALVNLTSRVARFLLAGVAIIVLLSQLGYSVTSVLAGLGIGGIALALGAQKTLENLFGAFALAVDQPIREGDFVKVDDFTGTVETIGLRSTRIRTLDRTLVAVPNGKLADMRLETFAARDRIRLYTKVGVLYGTTAAQLEQVLEGFRAALTAEEKFVAEGSIVVLSGLAESALEIEVVAFFATTNFDDFRRIREKVLLGFLKAVEAAGTEVAFPTVTVMPGK